MGTRRAAVALARGGARLVLTVWRKIAPARAFDDRLGAREIADEILLSVTA